jgi:hypothetical protein
VVVWFSILRLYGVGLGFGSPNLNLHYSMMILIPKLASINTSSIVFFPIYIWITTMWLSIATTIIPRSGTEELTCLYVVVLFKFWVFFSFRFCWRYLFHSRAILSNFPSLKYNLFLASTYNV